MTWYEKNVLSKNSMSNLDESANESDSLDECQIRMKTNMTPLNSLMTRHLIFKIVV
jgi:hypothetical protein